MVEQNITSLIGTLGFPIAVTAFLLIERSKTMKELTKAIESLTIVIKAKLK